MNKLVILLTFASILLLVACDRPEDRTFGVVETYRITSSDGTKSFLKVDLPLSNGYQKVTAITVVNADSHTITTYDGYQTVTAEIIGDDTETIVTVSYEVTLFHGIEGWEGDTVDEDLLPREFIDSDHQDILDATKPLIVEDDTFQTARNISDFVSRNMTFHDSEKQNQNTRSASEVLAKMEGVCGDYANLMTAMLKAAGIPARSVSGLVFHDLNAPADWSSPAGSHAWVEFHVFGTWYFADPTWGSEYFSNTSGYHLSYGSHPVSLDSQAVEASWDNIIQAGYTILGASTAPLKFVAWSEDQYATIVPRVEIVNR